MRKPGEKSLNEPATHEITKLLKDWSDGDSTALDRLIPMVYEELHRLAHQHMRRERADHVLQTSALINEAYLRLADQSSVIFANRAHFFGIAARLMRQILVDEARKRNSAKRGGGAIQVTLAEATTVAQEQAANVVALDDALKSLERIDARQGEIVELRFFGGLSIEETADVLKVSPGTVMRDWTFARAWLRNEMTGT
jgi:RNA polymerase sigma-70 factor, ECF subfamily